MVGLKALDLLDDQRAEHLLAIAEIAPAEQVNLAAIGRIPEFAGDQRPSW